jgi:hypothetical protein
LTAVKLTVKLESTEGADMRFWDWARTVVTAASVLFVASAVAFATVARVYGHG